MNPTVKLVPFNRLGLAVAVAMLMLVLSPAGVRAQASKYAGKNCLTAGCHNKLAEQRVVHEPIRQEDCNACHDNTNADKHTFDLTDESPALCFECHDDIEERIDDVGAKAHSAVRDGKCLECHNPHASANDYMLRADGSIKLCMSCHKDDLQLTGTIHPVIDQDGCLACHKGHDSEHRKLLTLAPAELCSDCHDETTDEIADFKHPHAPAAANDCDSCHNPHASPHSPLLVEEYSKKLYIPDKDRDKLSLCFECHDEEMLEPDIDPDTTGFRNGELNLHHLHVARERKGRSCRFCHMHHGSDQPKLIRSETPFGEWKLTIRFKALGNGGACGPGCHAPKRYDREKPVDLSEEVDSSIFKIEQK